MWELPPRCHSFVSARWRVKGLSLPQNLVGARLTHPIIDHPILTHPETKAPGGVASMPRPRRVIHFLKPPSLTMPPPIPHDASPLPNGT